MINLKDKILKYGSMGLFLLAPITYFASSLYPHVSPKTFFIYTIVEVLFFIWLYSIATDASYRFNKKILLYFIPAILFTLWMTLTGFFALNPNLSLFSTLARGTGLLTLYHSLAFSFIAVSLFKKYGSSYIDLFFKFFISGAILGVITIWLSAGGFGLNSGILVNGGEGGLMGNSSLAGAYMFFALAFSLFLIFSKNTSSFPKALLWGAIGIIIFSPLFFNICGLWNGQGIVGVARAGFLALFVSVFVFINFYLFLSNKKSIRNIGITFMVLSVFGFIFITNNFLTPGAMLHEKFTESATGTRFIFWNTASRAMHDSPILGYGLENYSVIFQKYFNPKILQKQNSMEGWADKPHNIYYEMGVSGGYPAIFFYFLFLGIIFYAIYVAYKNGKINRTQAGILSTLIVGYTFQNLFAFESNISILATFLVCGLVFSLAGNESVIVHKNKKENDEDNVILAILMVAFFVACFTFFVYRPMKKSIEYKETFSSSLGNSVPNYEELLAGSSIGSDWDASDSAYKVYQYYAFNASFIKNDQKHLPQLIKNLDALINYLYRVQETNKTDYRLYLTTVYLENTMTFLTSRTISPELKTKLYTSLAKAKELNNNDPNLYWTMAQLKVWEGDFKGAEKEYKDAINIDPASVDSHKNIIRFAQIIRDVKLYNEVIVQAEKDIPGFIEANKKELNLIAN